MRVMCGKNVSLGKPSPIGQHEGSPARFGFYGCSLVTEGIQKLVGSLVYDSIRECEGTVGVLPLVDLIVMQQFSNLLCPAR